MKLLFLHCLADISSGGGAELILWEQMKAFQTLGHECILAATSPGCGTTCETINGIKVYNVAIKNIYWSFRHGKRAPILKIIWHLFDIYNWRMAVNISEIIKKERPDMAIIHVLTGWSVATIITLKKLNVPTVQILHENYMICPSGLMYKKGINCDSQCITCRLFRFPHRFISNKIDAVVGVSNFILSRHIRNGYYSRVFKRHVIYNARSKILSEKSAEDRFLKGENIPLRCGYLGRIEEDKGVQILLDLMARHPNEKWELVIAGKGKSSLEEKIREQANRDHRISYLGRVPPAKLFSKIDVLIVPSLWHDTLPSVIFESFMAGIPVLGARRGGIVELVSDEENGLIFEPTDFSSLRNCLQRLAVEPLLWATLHKNALTSAERFSDIRGWVGRYENLLQTILQTKIA